LNLWGLEYAAEEQQLDLNIRCKVESLKKRSKLILLAVHLQMNSSPTFSSAKEKKHATGL
jgi:hypothetical protein